MKISKKRKNLLYFFVAALILTSLALIVILHNLNPPGHLEPPEPPGYLEVYDVEHGRNGYATTTFYLRWYGNKTEVKIKYYASEGRTQYLTVNDGDTFTVKTPTVVKRNLYTEIRYDQKAFVLSPSTGELHEIPWY